MAFARLWVNEEVPNGGGKVEPAAFCHADSFFWEFWR